MTQEHPITLPPELVTQWWGDTDQDFEAVATRAARWGADQELEACCHLLRQQGFDVVDDLRATRRPKPPSLKEQALRLIDSNSSYLDDDAMNIIRRALEQLDD